MNYKVMLYHLKTYQNILVTGPQRSGTTYFASQLAKDLNYTLIDEMQFDAHNETAFFNHLKGKNQVIQCPGMSHLLQKIPSQSLLIIFMMRNQEEINQSEQRINWHPREFLREKNKYLAEFGKKTVQKYTRNAAMKHQVWEEIQKSILKNDYIEMPFSILQQTEGYIPKYKRMNFKSKQTKC